MVIGHVMLIVAENMTSRRECSCTNGIHCKTVLRCVVHASLIHSEREIFRFSHDLSIEVVTHRPS